MGKVKAGERARGRRLIFQEQGGTLHAVTDRPFTPPHPHHPHLGLSLKQSAGCSACTERAGASERSFSLLSESRSCVIGAFS